MRSLFRISACALAFACGLGTLLAQSSQPAAVHPGDVWLDNRGQPIEAHGGGVIRYKGTFFWFGEDRTPSNDPAKRYVACYSSPDLVHWTFRNQVLQLSDPNHAASFVLERPKVYPNPRTHKFVMYAHLDDAHYKLAEVAVFTSDRVDGNYTFVKSFRPLNQESRDIGQFIDDDGSAYLIFESRPTKGFFIAQLSDDYLSVARQVSFIPAPLEGGALVHYKGLYYVIGSHMTGWKPNPNVYATATSLSGPWTAFKDIAPPEANTYDAQSAMLLKVSGTRTASVIFMGDQWKPRNLSDSRYLWMPVSIGDGNFALPPPQPWTINVHTGVTTLLGAPAVQP